MNDKGIIKSYSIEQIKNEQHLIINAYYMNQKVATTDGGSIDNIMEKVKLFNEEYETLQQENQLMFKIQDNYNQLQSNWNSLKELIENEKTRLAKECSHIYEDSLGKTKYVNEDIFNELDKVLDKMNELEKSDTIE